MTEVIQAPSPTGLLGEARGLLELPKLLLRFPDLARQPRGRGQSVLVLPGYGAGDASTAVLRAYLRFLGYRPRGWGLGRNDGEVPDLLRRVVERTEAVACAEGGAIRLIGWSLGGYLAREAARERPHVAHQVITLGSPVQGGPGATSLNRFVQLETGKSAEFMREAMRQRNRTPITVPITAIYSRSDGVVAWQAAIDDRNPTVEHIEVDGSHSGLGWNAQVYRLLARRLHKPLSA